VDAFTAHPMTWSAWTSRYCAISLFEAEGWRLEGYGRDVMPDRAECHRAKDFHDCEQLTLLGPADLYYSAFRQLHGPKRPARANQLD